MSCCKITGKTREIGYLLKDLVNHRGDGEARSFPRSQELIAFQARGRRSSLSFGTLSFLLSFLHRGFPSSASGFSTSDSFGAGHPARPVMLSQNRAWFASTNWETSLCDPGQFMNAIPSAIILLGTRGLNRVRSSHGLRTARLAQSCSIQGSLPAPRAGWPPAPLPHSRVRREGEPAGPSARHRPRRKGRRPPGTRPPSSRWAPNGRAALGPSVSPHVAPPRAVLPLAVAGPSGPAPLCVAGQTAPPRGAGSEVNGLE